MVNNKDIHRRAEEIYKQKRQRIERLLKNNGDLDVLDLIPILKVDLDGARVFRRDLAKHADLCDIASRRRLNDGERAQLAKTYIVLYPYVGHAGVEKLSALWLHTRPVRQARGS